MGRYSTQKTAYFIHRSICGAGKITVNLARSVNGRTTYAWQPGHPWVARHRQAIRGCQAIRRCPAIVRPSMDGLDPPLAPNNTSRLTPPSGVGKTGAVRWEIAAPTTSAGGRGPSQGRDFGGPGNGCRGWRPSGVWSRTGGEAGRAKQNVIFLCLGVSVFFFCLAELGGRRSGSPGVTRM